MTIGQTIRYYRNYCGMTQKEVAELLGISHTNVYRYEVDFYKPRRKRFLDIAKIVGMPDVVVSKFYAPAV